MVSKRTLSFRLTHQNHTKLVALAKQRGVPLNTALNLLLESLDTEEKPNIVSSAPKQEPKKQTALDAWVDEEELNVGD